MLDTIIDSIFDLSPAIRYVAVYKNGELSLRQRDSLQKAPSSDSDKYEELFINPTILKAVTQRGNLDCGGLNYILVRHGNFYQLVLPAEWGHASVCIEPLGDPLEHLERILVLLKA